MTTEPHPPFPVQRDKNCLQQIKGASTIRAPLIPEFGTPTMLPESSYHPCSRCTQCQQLSPTLSNITTTTSALPKAHHTSTSSIYTMRLHQHQLISVSSDALNAISSVLPTSTAETALLSNLGLSAASTCLFPDDTVRQLELIRRYEMTKMVATHLQKVVPWYNTWAASYATHTGEGERSENEKAEDDCKLNDQSRTFSIALALSAVKSKWSEHRSKIRSAIEEALPSLISNLLLQQISGAIVTSLTGSCVDEWNIQSPVVKYQIESVIRYGVGETMAVISTWVDPCKTPQSIE